MRLINFKQFETAKALLEKHTIEEIENGKMLEGMDEFAGMQNPIDSVRPLNEFLGGVFDIIINKITGILPGTAVNAADKILKEWQNLYSGKAKELIDNKRDVYNMRNKIKEAEESGSAQLDSLKAALETLEETQDDRKENNKKKWAAIENQLNTKIAELKKSNKDSERIQSYINVKLAEMRVNAYTAIEQEFKNFSTPDQIKAFADELEKEKKAFKEETDALAKDVKANADAEAKAKAGNPPAGETAPTADKTKTDGTKTDAEETKTKNELENEISLDGDTGEKPEEKSKETKPEEKSTPVKVVVDDIKPGARFIYHSNKYPEGKEIEILKVPEDSPVEVKYIGAEEDPNLKDGAVQTWNKEDLVDKLENVK